MSAGTLALQSASYSAALTDGSMAFNVSRSGGSSGSVSVNYATSDGTAQAGTNYTSTGGTLTWNSGDAASKQVTVALNAAQTFTGTKSFTLTLSNATGGGTLGSPSSATAVISGGGGATTAGSLALTAAAYPVAQAAGSVVIGIARSGGSSGAVKVAYSTADGTAVAGSDYSLTGGTLSWADGVSTTQSISVPVSTAVPFVGSRTFTVALSAATGGATLGSPSLATVTISGGGSGGNAAGGTFALTAAGYTVLQTAGAVTVGIARTGGSTGAASVAYATADGSATATSDYKGASGTLNWAAGDTAPKSVTLQISSTAPFVGNKTFAFAIASVSGSNVGSPSTAVVTIGGTASTAPVTGAMGQAAASRLLTQATFGPTLNGIITASGQTYDSWFAAQAAIAPSLTLPSVPNKDVDWYPVWLKNVVRGNDQLRQRMAFALSEIFVVSENVGPLSSEDQAIAAYYDVLVNNALGNYRTLLENVTLSPGMGLYLSVFRNNKPDPANGIHADENYAREVMQLFSIGLVQLNPDGTPVLNGTQPVPTYGQTEVQNMARVFTGWGSAPLLYTGENSWTYDQNLIAPMVAYANHHDTDAKTIVGGVSIPAGGTAAADLKIALDTLFNHPNTGPFISKQLIQHLVGSNPSPAYVARVAAVFNNNGQGVRGDLLAVAKAILTDAEAVSPSGSGKLREPLLRLTHLWRAFNAQDASGNVAEYEVLLNSTQDFLERPMQSPSVFNFFRPDYLRAGPLTAAGLLAPEFQITNANTLVRTENNLHNRAYEYVDSAGNKIGSPDFSSAQNLNGTSVLLQTAAWESVAADPGNLVDQMNLVFMQGRMPAAMRTTLVNYATGIPASQAASRVAEIADLIVNSPQYAIQQ